MTSVLTRILETFLCLLLVALVATVTWQIVSRFINQPSSVTEELARFQLIWLGFAGATYTFVKRMHVGIDLVTERLSGGARRLSDAFAWAMCALFAALLLLYGGARLMILTDTLGQRSAVLDVPMSAIYAIIPASGVIVLAVSLVYMVRSLSGEHLTASTETESTGD